MLRWKQVLLFVFLFFSVMSLVRTLASDPLPTPLMRRVEPPSARPGEVVTIFGDALDKTRVREVYLIEGNNEYKGEILEQTRDSIRFRLPDKVPAGRKGLMVLVAGEGKFIEQPAYIRVIE